MLCTTHRPNASSVLGGSIIFHVYNEMGIFNLIHNISFADVSFLGFSTGEFRMESCLICFRISNKLLGDRFVRICLK